MSTAVSGVLVVLKFGALTTGKSCVREESFDSLLIRILDELAVQTLGDVNGGLVVPECKTAKAS